MAKKRKIISIHEKKSQKLTWSKFFYWIALFSFLGAIFYSLFLSGFLAINRVEINGIRELDRKNIQNVVDSKIEGEHLGLINKNNLLFISGKSMEKDLTERFVKIESVKIRKKFPNALIIEIRERESSIVLCLSSDCYSIDKSGKAYSKLDCSLPEISENKLVVLRDLSDKSFNVGDLVFNVDYLDYIQKIEEKIILGADVYMEKNYETPSRVSSDIRGATKEGWRIFFNENIDLQKEIDMLRIVLNEKIGDRRTDLEYVDLRSDNKVYYKFKNGSQEEANKEEEKNKPVEENKVEEKKLKKKKN